MFGYAGQLMEVDLTKRMTSIKKIDPRFCREFIGGLGFATRLSLEIQKDAKPLGPENYLILAVGPLEGTLIPSSSGAVLVTKSPLNNGFCYDVLYGAFAAELKNAGYDAAVIKGKADSPVFLTISDNRRQIKDAEKLVGRTPKDCQEIIQKTLGDPFTEVLSIGIAGEKMVTYAGAVSDQTRMVGKGIGAIMGSKNLKAIAVRGTGKSSLAKPNEFFALSVNALMASRKMRGTGARNFGALFDASRINSISALPARNFQTCVFPGVDKLIQSMNAQYLVKVNACPPCPLACEHIYTVDHEDYGQFTVSLDYDSFWAFGPNCGINQAEPILKATELCYSYGLDVVQTGGIVSVIMECSESKSKENDGSFSKIEFGGSRELLAMIHKIANREGTGNILAEGADSIIKNIQASERGKTSVKGFQLPGCDPRVSKAVALFFSVSPCPDFPLSHGIMSKSIRHMLEPPSSQEMIAKLVIDFEDTEAVLNSMVLCLQSADILGGLERLAEAYTLGTGIELNGEDLRRAGERIDNCIRFFNNREGFARKDDVLPPRFFSAGATMAREEFESILDFYYQERRWTENGIVSVEDLRDVLEENTG